jgi:hypothetical protein
VKRIGEELIFRPKWDQCAPIIEGGTERWNELSIGKTSNELVDILLNEIIGGNDIVCENVHFFFIIN